MRLSSPNQTAPKQSTAQAPEQKPAPFIFPSLAFPPDRRLLRVNEVAERLRCSVEHVLNLLEEGKLAGVDIAGRYEYVCVPSVALDALAARCQLPREELLRIIEQAKPVPRRARKHWRILAREGFEKFLHENRSGLS